jgi:hypothetical protein
MRYMNCTVPTKGQRLSCVLNTSVHEMVEKIWYPTVRGTVKWENKNNDHIFSAGN